MSRAQCVSVPLIGGARAVTAEGKPVFVRSYAFAPLWLPPFSPVARVRANPAMSSYLEISGMTPTGITYASSRLQGFLHPGAHRRCSLPIEGRERSECGHSMISIFTCISHTKVSQST